MSGFAFGKSEKKKIEINIIPIINVIFLLIIFFVLAGTFKRADAVPINAPFSVSGSAVYTSPVEVMVSEHELIYDLELVSEEDLKAKLFELVKDDPNREVMLKADKDLDARKLIDTLDIIKKAGVKNLYLVTTSQR